MSTDRWLRLWRLVVEEADGGSIGVGDVCAAAISVCGVDGAAVTVLLSATPRETVYASDPAASELEELTLTLGEGPGMEAAAGGAVLVADLTAPDCLSRWPVFSPAATKVGIRAMFVFPLQLGAIRLGVMCLCRARPGGLAREPLADALLSADTVCALLLDPETRHPSTVDRFGPELEALHHPEVHQATGMVTVQLGVTAVVALVQLRAYAYAHDQRLRDVAADVVARRLRFHRDGRA